MSRYDSDMDHAEWLNGPDGWLVAYCRDCGVMLPAQDDDPGDCCDNCDRRRTEFEVNASDARRI